MKVFATRSFQGKVRFERTSIKVKTETGEEEKPVDKLKERQIFEKGKVYDISSSDFDELKQFGLREATESDLKKADSGDEDPDKKKK
jgi:hypothetical protein